MIDKAIKLKDCIFEFLNNENSEFNWINDNFWEDLKKIRNLLESFHQFSSHFEGDSYPTIHMSISSFNNFFDQLDDFDDSDVNGVYTTAIDAARRKLKKYYKLSDLTNVHIISSILNPSENIRYLCDNQWPDNRIKEARET